MKSNNLCLFPHGLRWIKFSVISPRSSCFEACCLRVIAEVLEFSGLNGWISYFEASNLRTFTKVFIEKVSLSKFLITIACDILTLIFFNTILAIKDTSVYFAAW